MRCPNCHQPNYHPAEPCPNCQFSGDPALIAELVHIIWMLDEADTWQAVGVDDATLQRVQQKYAARQRELEIALGLRAPPFTAEEAHQAWLELALYETLLQKLTEWQKASLLNPIISQIIVEQICTFVDELLERLEGYPRRAYPPSATIRQAAISFLFLVDAVENLRRNQAFATPEAETQILTALLAEKESLELKLGLRAAPTPMKEPVERVSPTKSGQAVPAAAEQAPTPAPVAAIPAPPAVPLRERLWQTFLSERTLHAILFLGTFLIFAAALSFVVWGWRDFSPLMRVAIPVGFTVIFFALGWYVRNKTPLYRSGIALSAIAALLIPIDFYTIYVNFHIPQDYWPEFWFISSIFCLIAYIIATLSIQSRFFGYLVGVAAGSTLLATIEISHQAFGLSRDWDSAGLSALALGLILLATAITRLPQPGRWRVFADPFRYLALLTVGVLMPLTFGWRFIDRDTYDALHYALTVNWWLGGFIFGWGAVFYRSRSLGLLAAIALPVAVYLAQSAVFHSMGINPAWHAFGWACLVPLYFTVGHRLLARKDDPIVHGHGRTATGWGVALLIIAALWSLTDLTSGAAAASSHTVLAGAVVLAVILWQRPSYLYAASLLSFSATTFATTELNLSLNQLSVCWVSLAIAHIIIALSLGNRPPRPHLNFAKPLVRAGYVIAALAVLPPLFPYDGDLLAYVLGNWLGLTAWGARLAHTRQRGFVPGDARRKAIFHWLTALPLPVWLWVTFVNQRPADFSLPLALAALAWGMVALSYRLARAHTAYRLPWYTTGLLVSVAAPIAAFAFAPSDFTLSLCLLSAGLLYFADAITMRQSIELAPAGLVTAAGYLLFLDHLYLSDDALSFALTVLIALYFLAALWTERQKSAVFTHRFLLPLYLTAHVLTLGALGQIYFRPYERVFFDALWTDERRLWGAAAQFLLGVMYGLYAWGTYRERWGHLAAWLGAASGGFIAIIYSTGRGSSAAKAALLAIIFVLAERGLYSLRRQPRLRRRRQAFIRLAWRLYKRPFLVTGWTISAGAIGLSLIRNLWLLGGGRVQQIWAAVGLLLITALYALSARLFRRARFVWLSAVLIFAPWTILTNLGWFTAYRLTVPGFAVSWVVLAWILFLLSLLVNRLATRAYALPLRVVAHVLLPFSLLWGVANVDTSRFTYGLAIGLYGTAAWLDYRRSVGSEKSGFQEKTRFLIALRATKFLYPALGLIPVWSVYLLAWLAPAARHEHYGLMLLIFGPLGLAAGQWFKRVARNRVFSPKPDFFSLPAYLTGYAALIVGTMLVAHIAPLLALALLYDAALMLVSARLFRDPLWVYPAAVIVPVSLLISLSEADVPANRHGWWLIGLAAIYLALAYLLRRAKLPAYGTSTLTVGFALIALGLPPSSQDKTGALWGYGGAALLYAITASWLRQPLLLTPASALAIVPYAISLQRSLILPEYYGLALFPGAVIALALGWTLDARFGGWRDFPWGSPPRWPVALAERLLGWWGLPLYALGLGLGAASPFFTEFTAELSALNFLLLVPLFGWAVYRFRLRVWLLATALAGHLAAVYLLDASDWWLYPASAWLRFLPVTIITALAALLIERRRGEGSPLAARRTFTGWSRPLYFIVLSDIIIAQTLSLGGTAAGAGVTLIHALLIAVFATVWLSSWIPYLSTTLGVVALLQWAATLGGRVENLPIVLAQLALGYGAVGYGMALFRRHSAADRELSPRLVLWELPLQNSSLILSFGILVLTLGLGVDLATWTVRAMFGLPFREIVDLATMWMVVGVLSWLGLLYVAAAVVYRRLRLGYVAIGMLLAGWMLYAFYIQQWDGLARVQWYAVPAGLYLLSIAYLEWRRGNKGLARWLDYAAMLLMMGSLFWQTLLFGWSYALLLGTEGFAAFWWGSARRLRRFFYAGMVGVILATVGQLINSLQSINQWIVFGIIGLLLVAAAIIVERKLEDIKAWQEILDSWE